MSISTKVELNLAGLDKLRRDVGNSYRARVGILGDKAAQDHTLKQNGERKKFRTSTGGATLTNYEIGVIQMFGSITNNILPRDFLVMPIRMNATEIVKQMKGSEVRKAVMEGNYKQVYKLLGVAALQWVLKAFETRGFGQWAPNKASTIDRKGSSMPLINTGQLRRAITSDVVGKSGFK